MMSAIAKAFWNIALTGKRSYSSQPLRALVFSSPGVPEQVISAGSFSPLRAPGNGQVTLRMKLAPINPADINVIEGVYPQKSRPRADLVSGQVRYIPGNEGLGKVVQIGAGVTNLKIGDRVVLGTAQPGTWTSHMHAMAETLIPVGDAISDVQGATISINPPTALSMLRGFATLSPGDYVIQNGANSAVGQAVIQIAHKLGLKTINLVRPRSNFDELKVQLTQLGGTHVMTYEELGKPDIKSVIKGMTGGDPISLGLNCVSGKDTTSMVRLLGQNAHLVSYGAMSKAPLSLPTSLFIFKNLTAHGFMMSKWYSEHSIDERKALITELVRIMEEGSLKAPVHEIINLKGSDDEITAHVRERLAGIAKGSVGKKVLLSFSE